MKNVIGRLGAIWLLVFWLVTVLFLYCIIIYSFDINISKSGRKNALISMVSNTESFNHFYGVDEEYGFDVDHNSSLEYAVEMFVGYKNSSFPICLTCGWYTREGPYIRQPYKIGDLIYTVEPEDWEGSDVPMRCFKTFDLKSKEFNYVTNLDEISSNAADLEYRVSKEYVTSNYEEISYQGSEDMDCFQIFLSVYVIYGMLIIWGLLMLLARRKRIYD